MCGIAGIIDLSGHRPIAPHRIRAMADALWHRGPDEEGYFERPGLALANRRLSIVGLADGQQPIYNEDRSIAVVFNGELFDYPEQKAFLEQKGHRFSTHCDTEIIPHRYEEHGEAFFEQFHGQFAIALHDSRKNILYLGRDRFGICPLYWTVQNTADGAWLLFASEIKALLASGMVPARVDPRGLNHLFTFFSMPGPVTCFEGIQALTPGHYLRIQMGGPGERARLSEQTYWAMDFPDRGQENPETDEKRLVDQFEEVMLAAVSRRLRADVPVVSYLSGGIDSSLVVAMASKVRGSAIPCFTIRIKARGLDETSEAGIVARHINTEPIVVDCGADEVRDTYPELIRAAESPVVDTSCAALLLLAREVHHRGFKVALTGEGADEWLAGYPWHKVNRALGYLDFIPGVPLSQFARRMFIKATGAPSFKPEIIQRVHNAVGGHNGWLDMYGLMSMSKLRFFSPDLYQSVANHVPFEDLGLNREKMKRWHPLNRELCLSGRAHLPGLLLNAKGDRVSMHSSLETRYPFLDDEVFSFISQIHPRWKLGGLKDKVILRKLGLRWLPKEIATRRKAMFRAPFDSFHLENAPPFIEQLLSEESLRKTGYFDAKAVAHWRQNYRKMWINQGQRISIEMGLVGVLATQLWHHTFLGGNLCELPGWSPATRSPDGSGHSVPLPITDQPGWRRGNTGVA